MLAIDTNLIVRYLTGDDARQSARALIDSQAVFVATTVFLESEWVLRSVYRFKPAEVARALAAFAGLPNVRLEDPPRVAKALAWMKGGMDFADALHLAAAEECEAFMSLDESFVKAARAAGANVRLA
jgi:predicted nucleic acid-binding protein